MARFSPLFSGSSGNCTYIGGAESGILVDAGVSAKRICEALAERSIAPEKIKAVFVTHEHSDHIKGLAVLVKKYGMPIVASEQTLSAVMRATELPSGARLIEIDKNGMEIDGIAVNRFATSHDCEGSSGYCFGLPHGQKISVCTDLGIVTDEVRNAIRGSDLTLIESNHDLKMLKNGPYPPLLKMRIMSDCGHLSNIACAAELGELLESGTTRFILGHISQHNNLPELALTVSRDALCAVGAKENEDYILKAAPAQGGEIITV